MARHNQRCKSQTHVNRIPARTNLVTINMTRIDFYILPDNESIHPLEYTCRMVEKVRNLGQRVYIHLQNREASQRLGELLWNHKPESFLPHEFAQEGGNPSQVVLGHDQLPDGHDDIMINISGQVPPFFSRFKRVVEIVPGDKSYRAKSRENFRRYKDRGYQMNTHDIRS